MIPRCPACESRDVVVLSTSLEAAGILHLRCECQRCAYLWTEGRQSPIAQR